MPITDPTQPDEERLHILEAVALGMSPMHPRLWEEIATEWESITGERPLLGGQQASPSPRRASGDGEGLRSLEEDETTLGAVGPVSHPHVHRPCG